MNTGVWRIHRVNVDDDRTLLLYEHKPLNSTTVYQYQRKVMSCIRIKHRLATQQIC